MFKRFIKDLYNVLRTIPQVWKTFRLMSKEEASFIKREKETGIIATFLFHFEQGTGMGPEIDEMKKIMLHEFLLMIPSIKKDGKVIVKEDLDTLCTYGESYGLDISTYQLDS